jgi:surface protein
MSLLFSGALAFDQDISAWNTGAVTAMNFMFFKAASFTNGGAALNWPNTSAVTTMHSMFYGASAFDQVVANWNVGKVMYMNFMFYNATAFNQDVGSWDVGRVTSMQGMFSVRHLPTPSTITHRSLVPRSSNIRRS